MRKLHQGGMFVLALALAAPSFMAARSAVAKTAAASSDDTAPAGMSKEDQDKLKEHNKLRTEIKKVKYPAAKATIVSHVKGIKPTTRSGSIRRCPTRRTPRRTRSSRRSAGRRPLLRPRSDRHRPGRVSFRSDRRGLTAPPLLFALLLALLPMSSAACGHSPSASGADLARVRRWWILIGASPVLEGVDWHQAAHDTQLVVLGGDPQIPPGKFPRETVRLGYLSVGEADPRRPYWNEVRGAPFLVEPNPAWPENVRGRSARSQVGKRSC